MTPEPAAPQEPEALPHAQPTASTKVHSIAERPIAPKRDALEFDERGLYRVTNSADEFRLAKLLIDTGAVNQSLKSPTHVMVAIQALKSVGLNPYTALRQVGFINGSLAFFGDLELAIVRKHPEFESIEEFTFALDADSHYVRRSYENSNLHLPAFGAICRLKRKGSAAVEEAFTEADAKTSGLWQRGPVWKNYPARMMSMRARGMAIRNTFSDATQGLSTIEYDHEGIDYGKGGPISHMQPA